MWTSNFYFFLFSSSEAALTWSPPDPPIWGPCDSTPMRDIALMILHHQRKVGLLMWASFTRSNLSESKHWVRGCRCRAERGELSAQTYRLYSDMWRRANHAHRESECKSSGVKLTPAVHTGDHCKSTMNTKDHFSSVGVNAAELTLLSLWFHRTHTRCNFYTDISVLHVFSCLYDTKWRIILEI